MSARLKAIDVVVNIWTEEAMAARPNTTHGFFVERLCEHIGRGTCPFNRLFGDGRGGCSLCGLAPKNAAPGIAKRRTFRRAPETHLRPACYAGEV